MDNTDALVNNCCIFMKYWGESNFACGLKAFSNSGLSPDSHKSPYTKILDVAKISTGYQQGMLIPPSCCKCIHFCEA